MFCCCRYFSIKHYTASAKDLTCVLQPINCFLRLPRRVRSFRLRVRSTCRQKTAPSIFFRVRVRHVERVRMSGGCELLLGAQQRCHFWSVVGLTCWRASRHRSPGARARGRGAGSMARQTHEEEEKTSRFRAAICWHARDARLDADSAT